jgi:hypothetical protein
MGSPDISFGAMLENDFGEAAEQNEPTERASSSAPTQPTAPEAMQVDEGASYASQHFFAEISRQLVRHNQCFRKRRKRQLLLTK